VDHKHLNKPEIVRKDLQIASKRWSYLQYNLHKILQDNLSIAAYAGDT
jgi:hypothetical protein